MNNDTLDWLLDVFDCEVDVRGTSGVRIVKIYDEDGNYLITLTEKDVKEASVSVIQRILSNAIAMRALKEVKRPFFGGKVRAG